MLWMCIRIASDSNTHPKHMILWRTYYKYAKNTVFCENFMSTETFMQCVERNTVKPNFPVYS